MAQRFSTHVCVSFVPYWNGTSCSHRMFIAYNGRRKGWGNAWINVSAKTFLQKTLWLFVTTLCLCSVWDEATWLGFWKTSWFETPVLVSTITDGECLTSLEKKKPKKTDGNVSLLDKKTNKQKKPKQFCHHLKQLDTSPSVLKNIQRCDSNSGRPFGRPFCMLVIMTPCPVATAG